MAVAVTKQARKGWARNMKKLLFSQALILQTCDSSLEHLPSRKLAVQAGMPQWQFF